MTDFSTQGPESLHQSNPDSKDAAHIERRILEAYARELEDAIDYRRRFFWWGVAITSVCVLASVGVIVFLVLHGDYETPVGVAFVSGLAVEVVGVAVVIAKYLFPEGGSRQRFPGDATVSEEEDA